MWPSVKLGEVLYLDLDRVTIDPTYEYEMVGVYSFGRGLFEREPVHGGNTSYKYFYRLHSDHVVMSQLFGWEGALAVSSEDLAGKYVSPQFPTFRVKSDKLDRDFLGWYMRRPVFWDDLGSRTKGMGDRRRTLNPDALFDCFIPLPPISEQRRIVEKVEWLAAKGDEANSLRKKSSQAISLLWKNEASTIFRSISRNYWKPIGNIVKIEGGGTPSKNNPAFWGGDIPWVSPKDMKQREIYDSMDRITHMGLEGSNAKLHEPGDILIVIRGMILAHTFPIAVLRVPATINQDMKALKPQKELLPEYLCNVLWGLNDRVLELVDRSSHDTRRLTTSKLTAFEIPIPPLQEQRQIVAHLDKFQGKINKLEVVQSQVQKELDALLPSILDKTFKGEV